MVRHLQHVHGGQAEPGRDVRLGVGREQHVDASEGGEQDDRVVVRVVIRRPLVGWPQHAYYEPADAKHVTGADDLHRGATIAGGRERPVPVVGRDRETGVEYTRHAE